MSGATLCLNGNGYSFENKERGGLMFIFMYSKDVFEKLYHVFSSGCVSHLVLRRNFKIFEKNGISKNDERAKYILLTYWLFGII